MPGGWKSLAALLCVVALASATRSEEGEDATPFALKRVETDKQLGERSKTSADGSYRFEAKAHVGNVIEVATDRVVYELGARPGRGDWEAQRTYSCYTFHPTEPYLVVGTAFYKEKTHKTGYPWNLGTIQVYDLRTGKKLPEKFGLGAGSIYEVTFSKDGKMMLFRAADRSVDGA